MKYADLKSATARLEARNQRLETESARLREALEAVVGSAVSDADRCVVCEAPAQQHVRGCAVRAAVATLAGGRP